MPVDLVSPGELVAVWQALQQRWFPEHIDLLDYRVIWSRRPQKRTLASCQLSARCVSVARELRPVTHRVWLKPLLYHEMCHAVLGDCALAGASRRQWHGPAFRALEQRHPLMPYFDAWVKQGGWAKAVRADRQRLSRLKARIAE